MSEITMSDAVRDLMAMDAEVVPARMIAPVLKMSESVLIHRVKNGEWDQDAMGKVVISGNRVKFLRKDFLIKCGFMKPEPEEVTIKDLLINLTNLITTIGQQLAVMMTPDQAEKMMIVMQQNEEELKQKRDRQCCDTGGVKGGAHE